MGREGVKLFNLCPHYTRVGEVSAMSGAIERSDYGYNLIFQKVYEHLTTFHREVIICSVSVLIGLSLRNYDRLIFIYIYINILPAFLALRRIYYSYFKPWNGHSVFLRNVGVYTQWDTRL